MNKNKQIDKMINLSGLICPIPLLKTKEALFNMTQGQVLQVITTDPASQIDLEVFTRRAGHQILDVKIHLGQFSYLIRHTRRNIE